MPITLPDDTICNTIAHGTAYNANYDIVWSFDYSLSGAPNSQGSFTTFLFDGEKTLSGCGLGQGGAYYPAGEFQIGSIVYTLSLGGETTSRFDGSRWNVPGEVPEGDPIGNLNFYTAASALTATIPLTQNITLPQVSALMLADSVLSAVFISADTPTTDIVWTFQGNVVGYIEEITDQGAYYTVLDYPNFYTPIGIDGAVLGVNFDTTGRFALTADSIDGLSEPILNSLTIRYGATDYSYLTSIPLTSLYTDFDLLLNSQSFNRLRFRLTNIGQLLKIDYKINDLFTEILSIPVNLTIIDTTKYKIGLGYTAPINGESAIGAKFSIKNFHVEGNTSTPSYEEISTPVTNSLAVYPVCALPAIDPPTTPTITRTLAKIPDVPCPIVDDSESSRGICLAEFDPLTGTETLGISSLNLAGIFLYTVSAAPTPPETFDPDPIIESCSLEYSDIIEFTGKTRDLVDYPRSFTTIIGAATGRVGFNYTVSDQSARFVVKYNDIEQIDTGYVNLGEEATYNLNSELALRNLPITALTALSSNTIYFNKTTSDPASAEILVYGPVDGARFTISLSCPSPVPITYPCGTLITGTNLTSPITSYYNYTPYTIELGADTGTVTVFYSAFGLPERFQVIYDNETVADTGWVGVSSQLFIDWLNSFLVKVGEPTVETLSSGSGFLSIDKSTSTETMEIRVYSPLYNSSWALSAGCPSSYIATFIPEEVVVDFIETFP